MKKFRKVFRYLSYFYNYVGAKLIAFVGLSIFVGLLDGFGLALFLPLLETAAEGPSAPHGEAMGNLAFLVDWLEAMGLEINLKVVMLSMGTLFALKGIVQYVELAFKAWLRMFFVKEIRFQMLDGIDTMRYEAFTLQDAGAMQNTISGEVWRIINAFNHYFSMFRFSIFLLTYAFLAFLANPQFALLVAFGGGLISAAYTHIYKLTKRYSRDVTSGGHQLQSLLIQSVLYHKYLKATGALGRFSAKLKQSIVDLEKTQYIMGRLTALLTASREPLIIIVVIIVIYLQISVFGGQLTNIILSLLFFYRSLGSLGNMQTAYNNFLSNIGALDNAKEFVQDLEKNKAYRGGTSIKDESIKEIRLENIEFSYNKSQAVLSGISFTIPSKSTTAFVGESGSGKTTVVNIIAGLLDSFQGQLKINDRGIQEIDKRTYQRKIGYITQEPVIFSDTLFNNVTLWAEPIDTNISAFEKAINEVALSDFYHDLPQGKDTLIGDFGQNLSGGQRQRISIARELFKDIEVLIMDEATSALDSEAENIIQENIRSLKGKYTIIMIAHRLSTIRFADQIFLLEKGTISASGTYDELNNNSSKFKEMTSLQNL